MLDNSKYLVDDLLNFIQTKGFHLDNDSLNIFIECEEICSKLNNVLFYSDLLLPLIKRDIAFNNIINKYGGNSQLAVEFIEDTFKKESEDKNRDDYDMEAYSSQERYNSRNQIIEACMRNAKKDNRMKINKTDIILALLNFHDQESPPFKNGAWTDVRFHTSYNTLSHIIGVYSDYLWVKNEDIIWEVQKEDIKRYDVAISFAGEDRMVAKEIADELYKQGKKVFYDDYEKVNLWGKNLYNYFNDIYGDRARYCLMIVSKNYAQKNWTNLERQIAQAKAFREKNEYILPLKLDDTTIPGLLPTIGYIDLRQTNINEVVNLIINKIV